MSKKKETQAKSSPKPGRPPSGPKAKPVVRYPAGGTIPLSDIRRAVALVRKRHQDASQGG